MELNLPKKLKKVLEKEAADARISTHAHIIKKLERITPPLETIDREKMVTNMAQLVNFLNRIPGVSVLSNDVTPDAWWWVKLDIDISHHLAWNVVQELGFVLNYISLNEQLPTVFKPVSPPPYLNEGPDECLSWVIESTYNYIDPQWITGELEARFPDPVDNEDEWTREE